MGSRFFFGWAPCGRAGKLGLRNRLPLLCLLTDGWGAVFLLDDRPTRQEVALEKFDVRIGCCCCSWCQTVLLPEEGVRVGEVKEVVEGMVEIRIRVKHRACV